MSENIMGLNSKIRENAMNLLLSNHSSWVKCIRRIDDAVIAPQTTREEAKQHFFDGNQRMSAAYNGGVYDKHGQIIAEAIHIGGSHRNVPDIESGEVKSRLEGRWLFGGFLRDHFGHFLTESLVRLWGLGEVDVEGIIFINYGGNPGVGRVWSRDQIQRRASAVLEIAYVKDTFRLISEGLPILFVNEATQVEELVVPTQLSGNINDRDFIGGHPDYGIFMRKTMSKYAPDVKNRKIYLSRSRLGPKSKFLLEEQFEALLQEEGFEIIHPQEMSVLKQIQTYRGSCKVVAATGSAIHLLALAAHEDMEVALLDRNFSASKKFKVQLVGMGGARVYEIDAINAIVRPEKDEDIENLRWFPLNAVYNLDIESAWQQLVEVGFVRHRKIPDFSQQADKNLKTINEIHDKPFILCERNRKLDRKFKTKSALLPDISYLEYLYNGVDSRQLD